MSYRFLVENGIANGLFPGIELIAGNRDKVLFHEVFGSSGREDGSRWKKDSLVDIASVTKVFTAAAVMKCSDEKLIDIDKPLEYYLSAAKVWKGLTLRHLASHYSGFDNTKIFFPALLNGADIADVIFQEKPASPPGSSFCYACINLVLLGLVVEKVTGQGLGEFCSEYIFTPLKMKRTQFGPVDKKLPDVVRMINIEECEISDGMARAARRPIGNAGIFSTSSELSKFCRMLLNEGVLDNVKVLGSGAVQSFETRINPPDGARARSFCWDMGRDLRPEGMSERTFYHSGWTGQTVFVDPGKSIFVCVLSNRRGDHATCKQLRTDIASELCREFLL